MSDEKIEEAVIDAANQEAEAAKAASEAAKSEAAKDIAIGASAAASAAESAKALAETTAAVKITENEETVKWLKSSAEATANSLNQLAESHSKLALSIPQMVQESQQQTLAEIKSLLTPPQSTQAPTPTADSQKASEDADDQQAAETKKKPKRGPQHKENWT